METGTIRLARELFEAAADMSGARREEFLRSRCADHPTLLSFVIGMLEEQERPASGLLDKPALNGIAGVLAAAPTPVPTLPARLGSYELIRVLGEGGMAVVYEAQQQNPSRTVAVKVLRPGVLSGELLRRFQHEIEVLGQLHHPGIAHIYEADVAEFVGPGGTAARQPYFAMELIRGEPLTAFAERHSLTDAQKLELVAAVCDAVEYAHQHGVIHRDLKPANILVEEASSQRDEENRSKPGSSLFASASAPPFRPKVLDFGVARVAGPGMATMNTEAGRIIGTLAYMSPEQVSGTHETDTRSDVYALGVILYELLARRPPHALQGVPLPDAMQRVREAEPRHLSTINRRFRGDVDVIVRRAMERNPARRYQSAHELAADIRRYLTGQPIEARRDSAIYVLQKAVRRHRTLAAATVLLVAGLVSFATYAMIQADRYENLSNNEHRWRVEAQAAQMDANAKEAVAEKEAAKAKMTSTFLKGVMELANRGARKTSDLTVLDLLDDATKRLQAGALAVEPEVEAEVRLSLAGTYYNLELYDGSLIHYHWLADYQRDAAGPDSEAYFKALNSLGHTEVEGGHEPEGQHTLLLALDLARNLKGPECDEVVSVLHALANSYQRERKYDDALFYSVPAAEMAAKLHGKNSRIACQCYWNLASVYAGLGRQDEVREMYRRAMAGLALSDKAVSPIRVRFNMYYAMRVLRKDGKLEEAEQHLRMVLDHAKRIMGVDHAETLSVTNSLAAVLVERGKPEEAKEILTGALATCRSVRNWVLPAESALAGTLSRILSAEKEFDQAAAMLRITQDRLERFRDPKDGQIMSVLLCIANVERDRGNVDAALALMDEGVRRATETYGEQDSRTAQWSKWAAEMRAGNASPEPQAPAAEPLPSSEPTTGG